MTHQSDACESESEGSATFITTEQLAERWGMHRGSIERMRAEGKGPKFFKVSPGASGSVRYRLTDVWAYENGK